MMPQKRRSCLSAVATGAVLLVASWSVGCGGSQIQIPRPTDRLAPHPAPPPVEPSVVNLQVNIPLTELAAAADQAVPPSNGREDAWQEAASLPGRGTVLYQYWILRGPVRFTVAQDQLLSEFTEMQYRLALRMSPADDIVVEGRCGYGNDPPKRLRLIARSRFSWTDHWTVRSHTEFDPPDFRDHCRVSGLNADVTPIVRSIVESRLPSLAAAIDAKVQARSESKQRAQKLWSLLQKPLDLGQERWLVLNPRHVQVSPIVSKVTDIHTSVNLILKPEVRLGSVPPSDLRPLEPLQLAPASLDGFHLVIPVIADYATINRRMQARLVGQEFESPVGKPIRITSAQLYGSGEQLIVELGVAGAVDGKLYATGKPVYDRETQTLRFEHFDYTADTRNVLVRSAVALFHQTFLDQIEPETRIDLSGRIETLRKKLSSLLTREVDPGLWLDATVDRFDALGIYPVPGGVEVQVVADGMMQLSMR